jgi:hypothetical protein
MTHLESRPFSDTGSESSAELDDELVREFKTLDDFLTTLDDNLDAAEKFDAACRFFRFKYRHSIVDFKHNPPKPMSKAELSDYLKQYAAENERMAAVAEFRAPFMDALVMHGVQSGPALLAKGSRWFVETDFPPYGKGAAFGSAILGRTLDHVTRQVLREVIDKLGIKGDYKRIMLDAGIPDYNTLYRKGHKWFLSLDFPPVGKGKALANQVLDHGHKPISSAILLDLVNKVGLPYIAEETIAEFRSILERNGIQNRETLFKKGSVWFKLHAFEPYGDGNGFARFILGHSVGNVTHKVLEEICHVLQLD